ncbi:hypothetical protein DUF477 [Gottschalkia acidurici 9a]|uniref:TPM domain-containing protein n=1 Tax=Gottschalkia acidurici (strain ATCC 7906 / DSM 604 / BCRC 14475 / CIP 104303 / KCTC 5404 / NCIMB 10678 / 9a) TaxID=1128398 RepID=K0AYU9_GOTA9|nr:TPM domain-containing protein [Gottschalkia acidurici]AFS77962.1 hypothetical protein DUF477 [Gottschalkia acidurici 9a]
MKIKNSRLLNIFLITLVLLSVVTLAYGEDLKLPKRSYDFYVYDEVGVISKDTEKHIVSVNKELYDKTGAQVVVAVVNSLQDRSKEEYATELFRKWKIGSKEKNNGILLLIAPNERELKIEVGYGLEGAITDGRAGEIRDKYITPYFKSEDYDEGILNGFNAILGYITNEYEISIEGVEPQEMPNQSRTMPNIFIIIPIFIFLIIDFTLFRGTLTIMILRVIFSGNGRGGGFGGGGFGGGSGGSRGGGGSSGGGGAGGSW